MKESTAASAKDHCHLGKAHVLTAVALDQLNEERERLDREIIAKAKKSQAKAAAKVASSGEESKSFKHVAKKITDLKKITVIMLSDV